MFPTVSAEHSSKLRLGVLPGIVVLFLGTAVWIVSIRAQPDDALLRLVVVVRSLLLAGGVAALWLAAAMGLGRLLRPLLRGAAHPWMLQLGGGIATLLWLEHALGWIGVLTYRPVAWGLAAAGVGLLAHQLRRSQFDLSGLSRLHPLSLLLAPPLAILAVAASSMPGWLWDAENYGFDVLEYHLQLPSEWLANGRLTSLHHNVYSYLPGYVEAAYLHIAAAFGSIDAAGGLVLLSAQFLQAALTVTMAAMAGLFVSASLRERTGAEGSVMAGTLASAVALSVPWAQVTGSLAYDEAAVNVLLLAGFVAVLDARLGPTARGVLVGWLAGVAGGAKLTGVFMAGAPLVLLLALRPAKVRAILCAAVTGLAALLPYLLRNLVDSGNPVFPFATGLFGAGDWSAEQVARWSAAHRFTGSLVERLALVWRNGAVHPLWSVLMVLLLLAVLIVWRDGALRPLALPLVAALAVQIAAWALLTHLFARFLLPMLPTAVLLIGLAGGSLRARGTTLARRSLVTSLCALSVLPLTTSSIANFAAQRRGDPAVFVQPHALDLRTGRFYTAHPEHAADAPIEYTTNYGLPPGSLVYFIGESRTLYALTPKLYHTPWDRSPLGELIRKSPSDPALWARGLAERGVTHIRVSFPELDRIQHKDAISDPLVSVPLVEGFLAAQARPLARKEGISGIYELLPGGSTGAAPPR